MGQDELARLSFSVHLLTYDTVSAFESAIGEAYFRTMLFTYGKGSPMPELTMNGIPAHDKKIIESYEKKLEAVRNNLPEWDLLLKMEEGYQKWLDASLRRKSKYRQ